MRSGLQRALVLATLVVAPARPAAPSDEVDARGVVIDEVGRGSALAAAGLRAGDVVLAWERLPDPPANPEGAAGEIRSFADWLWVKTEQAPRGKVRLRGERDGEAAVQAVAKGPWDARVLPRAAADPLRASTVTGDEARAALAAAVAEAPDPQARVALLEALGESYQYAGQLARAEASFRAAVEAGEAAWGECLQVASTLAKLGNVLRLQAKIESAAPLQQRALAIRERWAPESLEVTDSLHHLFLLAWERADLEAMVGHTDRALAIQQRWPRDSLAMVDTLNDLALLAAEQSRYAEAAETFQRAIVILEGRSPGSIPLATTIARLGAMAKMLGDLDAAVELLGRALTLRERLAPGSLGTVSILVNLGVIAEERGDLDTAQAYMERAAAIAERAAPRSHSMASSLNALGAVARARGELDKSWTLHQRALALREQQPGRSNEIAYTLVHLGLTAEARGDLDLALGFYLRAQENARSLEPGSTTEAVPLHSLARLHRRAGRLDEAASTFARALDALESQVGRLGGAQDPQALFRAYHEDIYREAIEVDLERGRAAEAFRLLERWRARSFLTLLAERDLTFADELPPELERARRDNAARYDRALRVRADWVLADGEEARATRDRVLGRLRQERDEIAAELRRSSPRLAALRQPQPLDLAAARQALDPGTLALSYSVGKERTVLFAVSREGGLRVEVLPLGAAGLRQEVERFLEQVRQPSGAGGPEAGRQPSVADLGRSLYRNLVAPVADLVGESERVLILPDGPLHRLPFGALVRNTPGGAAAGGQYLAEWKPLHTALSLTVYGTLRAADGRSSAGAAAAGPARLVAFGDPRYPRGGATASAPGAPGDPADPLRRSLGVGLRSFDWSALPHTRREVERLAEVYPGARLYLGEEATEERAKSVAREARILHFATHAHLDDRTPLDSALVLSIPEELAPGRDNGLLQVWEIFESVRLEADLVVLSACESALGRELSGEGMVGLTRAFQYAGARSVVATLWSVADQVTAELMARFHRHLAAGLPKDEALRAAQRELIREPLRTTTESGQAVTTDASAPFFWAAFQLFGDWR